jgi:hypothetical protein
MCLAVTTLVGAYWQSMAKALFGQARREAAYRRAVALTGQNPPGTVSWVSVASRTPFFWLLTRRVTLVAARSDSRGASDARRYVCPVGSSRQNVTLLRRNWTVRVFFADVGDVYSLTHSRK